LMEGTHSHRRVQARESTHVRTASRRRTHAGEDVVEDVRGQGNQAVRRPTARRRLHFSSLLGGRWRSRGF
jgi:hypothetical protein